MPLALDCPPSTSNFQKSEASYGKRLLYLADQVKDIKSEMSGLNERIRSLALQEVDLQKQIQAVEKSKEEALQKSGHQQSMVLYRSLLDRMSSLERTKSKLQKYDDLSKERESLINQREHQKVSVENLSPTRSTDTSSTVKSALLDSFKKWLTVLGTRSLPSPIMIDNNFDLQFGDQKLRGFSGSTLIRILLAYRTALYEVSKFLGGCHPGILIMDAPRQHEIAIDDFTRYFEAVKRELATEPEGLQVIISLSDQVFPQSISHNEIVPTMVDGQIKKFFGPVQ